MQRNAFFAAALLALPLAGCSLVIDVPADCDDANCGAYVCGEDGIECLDECSSDLECATGYVCDVPDARCLPTGCSPVFDPVVLDGLPGTINEIALGVGGTSEQMVVVVGRDGGLGFRRFNINGAVVADPTDEGLGLVRLADANEDRLPFFPVVRFVDSEDAAADEGAPRFAITWRGATETRDEIHLGSFIIEPPRAPTTRLLWQERLRTEVTRVDIRPNGLGLLSLWRAKSGQTGEVLAIASDLYGDVGEEQSVLLTPEDQVGDNPALGRVGDVFLAAYTTAGDGVRDFGASAVDGQGALLGRVSFRSDQPAASFRVEQVLGLSAGTAAGILWVENGDPDEVYLAVLDESDVRNLDPSDTLALPAIPIADDFNDVSLVRAADDDGGFVIGWVGERQGRTDLWVQRFDADGTPLFSPIPVLGSGAYEVDDYRLVSTREGIGVVWLTDGTGGNPDQLLYRRYTCSE